MKTTDESGDHFKKADTSNADQDLPALLAAAQTGEAINHHDGYTTYWIPIEHLAAVEMTGNKADEGYYGVVRNHWYQLNIRSSQKSAMVYSILRTALKSSYPTILKMYSTILPPASTSCPGRLSNRT